MKVKYQLLFSTMLLVIGSSNLFAQASAPQDSTSTNDTIRVKPNLEPSTVSSQGNFFVWPNSQIGFQIYAGNSVINTLRGHVPNFVFAPNSRSPVGSSESLLVIDGLPYHTSIGSNYNLNSFEYQNIYAYRSGNAATLYGSVGSNGSVFLQSKTGENVKGPTFEFNASPSVYWSEQSDLTGKSSTIRQWLFTNAVAYQQDYGALDTRVSYTFSALPYDNSATNTKSNYHALRVNTGLSLGSKFRARLIMDYLHNPTVYEATYFVPGQPPIQQMYDRQLTQRNLQANLRMQYSILPWLSLSAQSTLSKLETNNEASLPGAPESEQEQRRKLINLFVNANQSFGRDWIMRAFVGGQYEKQKLEREAHSNTFRFWLNTENKILTMLAGANIQFRSYLFTDLNYRMDYLSFYGPDNNSAPAYSMNTAFVFSEAWGLKSSIFSLGKIRASLGTVSVTPWHRYPVATPDAPYGYANPGLHASSKFVSEFGTDAAFVNDRFAVSINYFLNNEADLITKLTVPNGTNGTMTVLANFGSLKTNGWEAILIGRPRINTRLHWETKLIWSTYKTKLDLDYYGTGNGGGSGTSIGNPNPDWRGSFLNQITWKGFFSSFLVDMTKGGDIISYEYDGNFPTMLLIDGTMARLRDFSVGYRISIPEKQLQEIQVSVSGRNLWTIYSKLDDTEGSGTSLSNVQKNVSLSLSLRF